MEYGKPVDDVWEIPKINNSAKERLGYPTQKPEALLERIISASSNDGNLVLDPFCGCGTTISVAERLHRRWIGVDITHLAITLMKHRLQDTFRHELAPYEIIGLPGDLAGAKALAEQNRHQFEWWALSLVGARPAQDKRKGADRGVDGYLYFFDDESGQAKKIAVQVKSGHVNVAQIRDLKGTVDREKAVIGAFITLQEPTGPMKTEAAAAGFYETTIAVSGRTMKYPKIQIMTIDELLNGKDLRYPEWSLDATHKKAGRKSKKKPDEQTSFL
jgi:site-specific DNA-methyltransferase (adenine-specific)